MANGININYFMMSTTTCLPPSGSYLNVASFALIGTSKTTHPRILSPGLLFPALSAGLTTSVNVVSYCRPSVSLIVA